jgi:drug/metabolite transporter (DMT)-like permease
MNNLELGILLGLIALISGGLSNAMVKTPSQVEGVNKTIFYRNLFITILLLALVILTPDKTNFSWKYAIFTFLLAIFGYIPMYYYYKATTVGKIGVVSPVSSGNILIAIILATIFFHERLTSLQYLAIAVIIFGVVLISLNVKDFKSSKIFQVESGIPYALIAALGWGIWMAFVKISIDNLGPYLASFIGELTILLIATFLLIKSKENFGLKTNKSLYFLLPIAIFLFAWEIGYYTGLKVANVSIIVALSSASPIVVALFGRFFYKEKLSSKQYMAIMIIIIGMIALSIK